MVQSRMKHHLIKSCSGGTLPSSSFRKFESADCNTDPMLGETMIFKDRNLVIQKKIATGSFSKIYKGTISIKSPGFALKFLSNKSTTDKKRVAHEMEVIKSISKKAAYRNHFPRFISMTSFKDYKCIIMERMNTNLRFYMSNSRRRLFKLKDIRQISKQLLSASVYLHNMEYIHTNIKPENIMIVDVKASSIQVKLTGFGHAITTSSALSFTGMQLQSLHYRSPEILFGLPFCDSIDIWSIGCVLAELYTGIVLYPGKTEAQMIKFIAETQGFPSHLEHSKYWSHYVVPAESDEMEKPQKCYRLKTDSEFRDSEVICAKDDRLNPIRDLNQIIYRGYNQLYEHRMRESDRLFASFLIRLLDLSALRRITAKAALEDGFIKKIESDYKMIPTVEL